MSNTSLLSFLSCFIGGINLLLLVGIYLRGFKMGIFDQGNGMVTCDLQEEEELAGATADNYRPDDSFSGLFNPKTGERVHLETLAGYAQVPYGVTCSDKDRGPKMTYDTLDLNPNRVIEDVNNQTAGAVQMPYAPIFSPAQLLGLSNPVSPQEPSKAGLSASGSIALSEPCARGSIAFGMADLNQKEIPSSHRAQTQLDILMPEGEMLSELLNLSEWIMNPCLNTGEESAEAEKWECINNVYCAVSWGRDREKAEIIRRYFKRLDTTYVRKDGTYYSVVTEGNLAKKVINDLIEVYPWDNLSVLDGYRKNNPKEPVKPKVKVEPKQKPNSLAEAVDELLEAVKKVKDAVR